MDFFDTKLMKIEEKRKRNEVKIEEKRGNEMIIEE